MSFPNFVNLSNSPDIFDTVTIKIVIFFLITLSLSVSLSLIGQCTDSDGCAVDRARAWCEMIDTIYHRSADYECVALWSSFSFF